MHTKTWKKKKKMQREIADPTLGANLQQSLKALVEHFLPVTVRSIVFSTE